MNQSLEGQSAAEVFSAPLVFPDPIVSPDQISGAGFLYFSRPLVFTNPRLLLVERSLELVRAVETRKPVWGPDFLRAFGIHRGQIQAFRHTDDVLTPLKDAIFRLHVAYSGTLEAFEDAGALAASAGIGLDELARVAELGQASGEVMYHLMTETFLENNEDVDATLRYCDDFFSRAPISQLLAQAYLVRLSVMRGWLFGHGPVLLTNPNLLPILERLPVHSTTAQQPGDRDDMIAWLIFRNILSPYVDPLDRARAEMLAQLREGRADEIDRLRRKCRSVALDLSVPDETLQAVEQVRKYVEANVEKEVGDLLQLDKKALKALFRDVATDEKTWAALAGGGYATLDGLLAGGAALAALAAVTAPKIIKAALDRRDMLQTSDYALIYSIARRPLITVRP